MQITEYLICVASRHEQAKDEHQDEIMELMIRKKNGANSSKRFSLTYDDELEVIKGVLESIHDKPVNLEGLSSPAIGALAYIFMSKLANEIFISGHEVIFKLVCDPEKTVVYLNALTELIDKRWIRIMEQKGLTFINQPPYSWLQSCFELGDTFHKEMGETRDCHRPFASNDSYLDAVCAFLHVVIHTETNLYRVLDTDVDLKSFEIEGWYWLITQRVEASTCELPAAESIQKYELSVFQHLAMIGLIGMREGDLQYEFTEPFSVANLFSRGRVSRKRMIEHLYGEKSELKRNRLVHGTQSIFGESVQLTNEGMLALIGRQGSRSTGKELKSKVKKLTLFDIEEPNVKTESLLLPQSVMEAIRSLIFSESRKGKQLRKKWQTSLPSAWGSPTGSTVLLYGPPGTGKTLTAQYLASELKLPLLKIDASRVLSCWVGESEQNVRRIFDDYSMLQKELGTCPILLLNEADQLLGARDAGSNSIERMNNNMQNLFLEGLERFSGILVATTNRRDLLDEAFSRRFTYKLELPPPDKNLRIALWKSHLPMNRLDDDIEISQLADLGLTGGEIRLVVERAVRMLAYRGGTRIDRKTLMEIAQDELFNRMNRNSSIKRIGFAVNELELKGGGFINQ